MEVKHGGAMSDRKPFAGCFPPTGICEQIPYLLLLLRSFAAAQDDRWEAGRKSQNTMVPCRIGNHTQAVSCPNEPPYCLAKQETYFPKETFFKILLTMMNLGIILYE